MRPFKIEPFIEFNLEETIVKGDFCIFFYNNSMMNSKVKKIYNLEFI